jgi:Domain of unknown function (DUF3291)
MDDFELCELNVARLAAPLDSPALADFVANLARINALAESSPGFVWRLQTDAGDATALRPFGEDTLVNLSVWRDAESLATYAYRSAHAEIMQRRREWFAKSSEPSLVLWWKAAGERPTLAEAQEKLALLRERGVSAAAFTLKQRFPKPARSAARTRE